MRILKLKKATVNLTDKNCIKCSKVFLLDARRLKFPNSIDTVLCDSCLAEWLAFFDEWHMVYNSKYPKRQNPTWEAFTGELPNFSRERVEFT